MFNFALRSESGNSFVDNSDRITVNQNDEIAMTTTSLFLKDYTENLFKKLGKDKKEEIVNHLNTLCNDMIANGHCSPEVKKEIEVVIKNCVAPSFSTRDFIAKHQDSFIKISTESDSIENPVEFYGASVHNTIDNIVKRYGKQLII